MPRTTHNCYVQGKRIYQVDAYSLVVTNNTVAPNMAHDARIIKNAAINSNPLDKPGLRLGDWSQVKETK